MGWCSVASEAVENLKQVRKSAEGYLGKYMTKGSDGAAKLVEWYGEAVLPGQWWFMSKAMRDEVKRARFKGHNAGHLLEEFINHHFASNWLACPAWIQSHYIVHNEAVLLVGYSGRVSSEQHQDLKELIEGMNEAGFRMG